MAALQILVDAEVNYAGRYLTDTRQRQFDDGRHDDYELPKLKLAPRFELTAEAVGHFPV